MKLGGNGSFSQRTWVFALLSQYFWDQVKIACGFNFRPGPANNRYFHGFNTHGFEYTRETRRILFLTIMITLLGY